MGKLDLSVREYRTEWSGMTPGDCKLVLVRSARPFTTLVVVRLPRLSCLN